MVGRAARVGHVGRRVLRSGICLGVVQLASLCRHPRLRAESLPEALAKAYQTNPQLNAERARQRATDENVPQALAGYRPQIVASLSAGLQAVRNLLPDNTIQTAQPEAVDHRRDGDADAVQRLQDRQQRARGGTAGAVRPRGTAQCRPGRAARRRHRLHQRAGQPVAGRGAALQRRVPAGDRSASPRSASMPATSRRPTPRRPRRGSAAALPISTPPKSISRSARRPTPR